MNTYNLDYTSNNLDRLCDLAVQSKEEIIIERAGKESIALIPTSELSSIKETLYLLSSPINANRIFEAWEQGKENQIKPQTIDELFAELEFNESK